ncbi:hypothetical protein PtA15_12A183 [Puccinia triticina]|uniref:Uncharacterized protein n=1 Tax=Puccinia triticina TaxID=208348 RepID=A0ABY7D1Q5_9BASI|nr:uncharacterized protein PtA15_12A183 [Puccinia triticina]WAQ90197.1 hypothetical protein PtA15_12A183 [Puccinia triticina]
MSDPSQSAWVTPVHSPASVQSLVSINSPASVQPPVSINSPAGQHNAAENAVEERLVALERKVRSIVGFDDGLAFEGLPTLAGRITRLGQRLAKLRSEVVDLPLCARVERTDQVTAHVNALATHLNTVTERFMEFEAFVRGHMGRNEGAQANPGAGQSDLDLFLEVLHRPNGARMVSDRLGTLSSKERINMATACLKKIAEIRKKEILFCSQTFEDLGARMLVNEDQFQAQVSQVLSERPDYQVIRLELACVYALVRIMKDSGIITEEGLPIAVNGAREGGDLESEQGPNVSMRADTPAEVNVAQNDQEPGQDGIKLQ